MRSDLTPGQAIAQACHAAAESSSGTTVGTFLVVLAVESEERLLKYHKKLTKAGFNHVLFREPDMDNQATAIGVYPIESRDGIRKILGHLPLYGVAPTTTSS